jgi:DNA modification methylase
MGEIVKQPEYQGAMWAIHNSDCIEAMHSMPAQSVDCVITSVPFGDLFTYSDSERDLGNAGTGDEWLAQYRFFAEALVRVVKPGRMVCIHCTDLPSRKGRDGYIGLKDFSGDLIKAHEAAGMYYHGRATIWKDPVVEMQRTKALGLLYKQIRKDSAMNRVGMPDYMLFFRAPGENPDRIEHGAPGSTDAVDIAHKWLREMHKIGLASETPTQAQIAAMIEHAEFDVMEWQKLASPVWMDIQQGNVLNRMKAENDERHVCPLQLGTIERCLRLYSKPGDVVLDPFNGIGSTGYQAVKMYRRYLGFELKPEYAQQAGVFLSDAEASIGDLFTAAG